MNDQQPELGARIGGIMIGLLFLLALGGGTLLIQQWLDRRAEARAPEVILGADSAELRVQADRRGHYEIVGLVNGVAMPFLIDTGATGISIPAHLGEKLGLKRGRGERVSTANGEVRVAMTRIDSLKIGPFKRQNVTAHLNPGMRDTGLLGMTFLRHLNIRQENGVLTLHGQR